MADAILVCKKCQKTFSRSVGEVHRNADLKRDTFCSIACATSSRLLGKKNPRAILNFGDKRCIGRDLDDLSPFRWFLKVCKCRSSERPEAKQLELSAEDLKKTWEDQKGVCPLTGWKMQLPRGSHACWEGIPWFKRPSLDRKDSKRGYVRDNVRFVARIVNFAKNAGTDNDVLEFCEAVVAFRRCSSAGRAGGI